MQDARPNVIKDGDYGNRNTKARTRHQDREFQEVHLHIIASLPAKDVAAACYLSCHGRSKADGAAQLLVHR